MRYFDQSKSMLTDWYTRSIQQGLCSGQKREYSLEGVDWSVLVRIMMWSVTAKKLYLRRLSVVMNIVWLLFDSIFVLCVGCCICIVYVSLLFGCIHLCCILYQVRIFSYSTVFVLWRFTLVGGVQRVSWCCKGVPTSTLIKEVTNVFVGCSCWCQHQFAETMVGYCIWRVQPVEG